MSQFVDLEAECTRQAAIDTDEPEVIDLTYSSESESDGPYNVSQGSSFKCRCHLPHALDEDSSDERPSAHPSPMEEAKGDLSLLSPNSRVAKRRIQEVEAGASPSTRLAMRRHLKRTKRVPPEIADLLKSKPLPKVYPKPVHFTFKEPEERFR